MDNNQSILYTKPKKKRKGISSYSPRLSQCQSLSKSLHTENGGNLLDQGPCLARGGTLRAELGELRLEAGVGGDVDVGWKGHCMKSGA
jgi:hypothetical protein